MTVASSYHENIFVSLSHVESNNRVIKKKWMKSELLGESFINKIIMQEKSDYKRWIIKMTCSCGKFNKNRGHSCTNQKSIKIRLFNDRIDHDFCIFALY